MRKIKYNKTSGSLTDNRWRPEVYIEVVQKVLETSLMFVPLFEQVSINVWSREESPGSVGQDAG